MTVSRMAIAIVLILGLGALIPLGSTSTTASFSCDVPKVHQGDAIDFDGVEVDCALDERTVQESRQFYGFITGSTETGRTLSGEYQEMIEAVQSGETLFPPNELSVCLFAIEASLESGEVSPLLTRETSPEDPNDFRFSCIRQV